VRLKDDDDDDGSIIDMLTIAAQHLAEACPSLRLISFCVDKIGICAQYAPLADHTEDMEPLDKPSDELDGKPIRFWLPPKEIEVLPERYQGHCATTHWTE
jgi:hypothetical protein